MAKNITVAITGSIGSGKSSAASIISSEGYKVISADTIAHEVLDYPEIMNRLIELFGRDILTGDTDKKGQTGKIDRNALGKIVFSDKAKLKLLNDTVHPYIMAAMAKMIADFKNSTDTNDSKQFLFFEVPLLFETGIDDMFDLTVNIAAPIKMRISRVQAATGLTKEDILKRVNAQLPEELKEAKADITIRNDESLKSLSEKIKSLINNLQVRAEYI